MLDKPDSFNFVSIYLKKNKKTRNKETATQADTKNSFHQVLKASADKSVSIIPVKTDRIIYV